jgi:hypothetical protein
MKKIFVVAISIFLVVRQIFLRLKGIKINHPNADLLTEMLNRCCCDSPAPGPKNNKNPNHGKA